MLLSIQMFYYYYFHAASIILPHCLLAPSNGQSVNCSHLMHAQTETAACFSEPVEPRYDTIGMRYSAN